MRARWSHAGDSRSMTRMAYPASLHKGSQDEQAPEKEPRIPQVGMPFQRPVVGIGGRHNGARLDEQADDGQHQAVGRQDHRLDPGQAAQPSLPLLDGGQRLLEGREQRTERDKRQARRDRLQHDRRPDRDLDASTALAGCQRAGGGREQPGPAEAPVQADRDVAESADESGPARSEALPVSLKILSSYRLHGPDSALYLTAGQSRAAVSSPG